jgi:hypothetical protein
VHLPHAHHADHREEALHLVVGAGLFIGFARSALGGGFAKLHEARGQRPFAPARLDVALAQQHLVAEHGNGAHHVQRVLVVDGAAGGADGAFLGVAIVRNAVDHRGAAVLAVLDGYAQDHEA